MITKYITTIHPQHFDDSIKVIHIGNNVYKVTGQNADINQWSNTSEGTESTIPELQQAKKKEFANRFVLSTTHLYKKYRQQEISSWFVQVHEAEAYMRDNTLRSPILDVIAENKSMEKEQLVDVILTKHSSYKHTMSMMLGKKQQCFQQIENAATTKELDSISWDK